MEEDTQHCLDLQDSYCSIAEPQSGPVAVELGSERAPDTAPVAEERLGLHR